MESKSGENLEAPIKINLPLCSRKGSGESKTGDDIPTYVSLSLASSYYLPIEE